MGVREGARAFFEDLPIAAVIGRHFGENLVHLPTHPPADATVGTGQR